MIVAVGTRLQDFTTGSWALFKHPDRRIVAINVTPYDAHKHNALPLIADAKLALEELSGLLGDWRAPDVGALKAEWTAAVDAVTAAPEDTNALPTDMQVIGAVQRSLARGRDRRLRRRRPAGRAAQALAGGAAERLPPRVRLLDAWATRSPAGSASRWRTPTARSW